MLYEDDDLPGGSAFEDVRKAFLDAAQGGDALEHLSACHSQWLCARSSARWYAYDEELLFT
jgi:hypothetical protein